MPVNYLLLKESEKNIIVEFLEFYEMFLKMNIEINKQIKNSIKNETSFNDKSFEDMNERGKNIEIMYHDLLSNCIWIIQKDEPRASHLRFIIAIIYSIKNLMNGCNHILKISKLLNKKKMDDKPLKEILNCFNISIKISNDIYKTIADNNLNKMKETLKEELNKYHKEVKTIIKKVIIDYNNENYCDSSQLIDVILTIGRIERIVNTQENIIDDFSYIKDYRY